MVIIMFATGLLAGAGIGALVRATRRWSLVPQWQHMPAKLSLALH